jgi:hypothetical protein
MADAWFHVMHNANHIAVFRMKSDGARELFLPSAKVAAALSRYIAIAPYMTHWFGPRIDKEAFALYSVAAPYLDTWFSRHVGRKFNDHADNAIQPGDERYPRALASVFARDSMDTAHRTKPTSIALLNLWAYVTPTTLSISFRQIAQVLAQEATAGLRQDLEAKGLRFTTEDGSVYVTSIEMTMKVLGSQIADGVTLYPRHIADFLGVAARGASDIARAQGIGFERTDGVTTVTWGNLRRVKRTGPRKFEMIGSE